MCKMIMEVKFQRHQFQSNTLELQSNDLSFVLHSFILTSHKNCWFFIVFHNTTVYYGQKI